VLNNIVVEHGSGSGARAPDLMLSSLTVPTPTVSPGRCCGRKINAVIPQKRDEIASAVPTRATRRPAADTG
jgi:hypothetical protein